MGTLSKHFDNADVTRSATATKLKIDNSLPESLQANAKAQAELLESCRAFLCKRFCGEVGLAVSSWFRCPELNSAVGGNEHSAHMQALATDCLPMGISLDAAFVAISEDKGLMQKIDQLIIEHDKQGHTWLHIAQKANPMENRHQAFRLEKKDAVRSGN